MTLSRAQRGGERGAALVEFAIVLPVFLMLVLGAIDWGWFFLVQDAVSNAAREGARAAIVGGSGVGATRAKTVLNSMLPAAEAGRCSTDQSVVTSGWRVDATCPVGSLSGVTRIPPFSWVIPTSATARVEMRN
jgi:Flp pilus assembly protein TadG